MKKFFLFILVLPLFVVLILIPFKNKINANSVPSCDLDIAPGPFNVGDRVWCDT
jgi:hypothetical protein